MIFNFIEQIQNNFHETIALSFRQLQAGGSIETAFALMLAGFLYGVFHAAGPGHGKLIMASYMMADEATLKRGLAITALSSLMQGMVAILLVLVLFFGLGLARQKTEWIAAWFEAGSFALVAFIGAMLMWRGIRSLKTKNQCCDHHHEGHTQSKQSMLAMTISIGIRPCSGGLLLMFFACLMNEITAGIAATFAMSVGTGLATSIIAVAAAHSRKGLLSVIGKSEQNLKYASAAIKIIAGALIVLIGASLALSSVP